MIKQSETIKLLESQAASITALRAEVAELKATLEVARAALEFSIRYNTMYVGVTRQEEALAAIKEKP